MIELRCINSDCRHDFVFDHPSRLLGQEVKCPLCGAVSVVTGEDSDEGFAFYLEVGS